MEGVEGEDTSPRLMATPSLLSHRPGLVVVRGSRTNVRDHQSHTRRAQTHSFLRRGLPLRALQALQAVTATRAKGVVGLGVRRRPAEDGGVGAPPPAGRAECRHRPEPHPYQGSAPGPISAGSPLRPGRTMNRWRPLRTAGFRWDVDQTWTKLAPSGLTVSAVRPPPLWSSSAHLVGEREQHTGGHAPIAIGGGCVRRRHPCRARR
jgi:hypothetical protein